MRMEISSLEAKDKLRRLSQLLKNKKGGRYTYYFADYLADQLEDSVTPELFLLRVNLAFEDLARGKDTTGKPIMHEAADRVPAAAPLIRLDIPDIVDIIFPPDFAEEVKKVKAEVEEEVKRFMKTNKPY